MTEPTELKTERLLLRPFRLEDVDDVFAYAKDPEWAWYFPRVPKPFTRQAAEERVARHVLESWETHPTWAVVLHEKVIGGIWLMHFQNETATLGYELSRVHWGKGLIPEAAQAVIDWAFKEYELAKISASTDLQHLRSTRVMEKVGMTREGVFRSHKRGRGERIDEVYYGILREEWDKRSTDRQHYT